MLGTLVNAVSIICGALLGLLFKKSIPERYQVTIMQGVGMVIAVIGVQMALKGNMLILIGSIAFGGLVGEFLDLDKLLDALGERLTKYVERFPWTGGRRQESLRDGFVTATLVYCVGAMSIVGSIQDGLTGDSSILFVKALLDGVTAIFFASSLGVGVAFAALPVLLYQGGISLAAGLISPFLSEKVLAEMTATGGILIMGISLLVLKIYTVKIANLLPSLIFAVLFALLYTKMF